MKYSQEITEQICQHLSQGLGRVDTTDMVGISYETFTQWMKKPEFAEAIKRAEAKCKQRNIALIQKAAITTWQAAAWWLERKHRDEFALRTEHTGRNGEALTVNVISYASVKRPS
jgi:hypothetical protein